jgi:putative PEP-CTERM system TPR-repeat lipoprotein
MMRRLIIAIAIVLLTAGAAGAGWHYLRPRDPLAEAQKLLDRGDVHAAQLELRRAVQSDPARAEAHVSLGRVQIQLGDPAAAEHEFRAAGERGYDAKALRPLLARAVVEQGRNAEVLRDYAPDGLTADQAAEVLVARAQAQLSLGQPQDAAASVAEAQRLAPKSVATALAAARLAIATNDLAAAEQHVGEALAIDPNGLQALILHAELRDARGDRTAAIEGYGVAIDRAQSAGAPGAADALRLSRARLLIATNQNARARADLDVVLKAQPKQPTGQFFSALLFARAGDWKAADAALAAAGPLLSRLPEGDLTLAVVKANLGQPEQAIAAAERQVARTPGDLTAAKLLAQLDMAQKLPDRAADVLAATAAAGQALDVEALDILSTAYAGAGKLGQAVTATQQAVELMPDDARLLGRLAALQLRRGDAPQAEHALERALNAAPAPATTVSSEAPPSQIPSPGPSQAQTAAALVSAALQSGDIDQAAAALDRLRQAGGSPEQIALLDGTLKLARIDLDGARAAFEEAVRLDPNAPPAHIRLARVLALQGHTDEAVGQLQPILVADPANAQALAAMVNVQLAAGHPDQAVAAAEAAHQAAPHETAITAGLAGLYVRIRQPQKALDLLDAVRKQGGDPADDRELAGVRAQAQLELGQSGAAAQTLRILLDQSPDNVALRREIAELLAADKKYDEAGWLLRDGLARRPGDPVLLGAAVAVAQREGGPEAALARVAELSRDPANAVSAVLKGDVLVTVGRYADAAAAYQAVLTSLPKDDPKAAGLEIRVAQAVAAGGDAEKAAGMLRDWLVAHPDSAEVSLVLASYDISSNRLADARTRLEAVLASQPNNPIALNNLAWVVQQAGDLPRARALAARAYLLRPTPRAADTLGWIVLAQGQTADAAALLHEAANELPGDPSIQYHFAAALAADGKKDAAVALLKSLLAKPPAGFGEKPQAAKLLAQLAP